MKRIVVVNVNWIGDVLFSTPFFRCLKKNIPDSYVASIVTPSCMEILTLNHNIDKIISFDERKTHKTIASKINFIKFLKSERFDTAFLLHRSFTKTFVIRLAGISNTIGYSYKKRNFLLKKIIPMPQYDMHRADFYLNILGHLGFVLDDQGCDFFISKDDEIYIDNILTEKIDKNKKIVAVNMGGNWLPKRWPLENFAGLIDKIIKELDVQVVITGSAKDAVLAEKIAGGENTRIMSLCGRTNLKQLAALFKKTDLVISSDTGPLHIAASVGAKVLGMYGPTSPDITGPYRIKNAVIIQNKDLKCKIPCYDISCQSNDCMKEIVVSEVFAKSKDILGL